MSNFYHALTSNQKWTLGSTISGFGLENMDGMFVSFALSSMIMSLGISKTAAGFILTVTSVGSLLGGLIFGLLADKFGRVKVFTYSIFIFAFATAAMYFAKNVEMVYLFRFLSGFGTGGEYGAGITLIAENFSKHKIGKLTSLASIGGQIGAILAAGISALVIPYFGWHALFLVGLVPVVFAYIFRRKLKESKEYVQTKANHSKSKVSISRLFNSPKIAYQSIALMIMVFVQTAGYYGLMTWLPSLMQKQLKISVSKSSLWMITTIIGMSLGMLAFGTIMDRFGPRISFGIFLIASAVSVYSILLSFNAESLLLAAFVLGFFSDGMYGGYGVIVSRLYPTEIRATANDTIVSIGKFVGKGFSPLLIGFMLDHASLFAVMGMLSALYIISFTIMMTIPSLRKLALNFKQKNTVKE